VPSGLLIIIALFALLYFVMIRPQQMRQRQQARLLNDVAVGDEILTVGGIYGIVQELEPEEEGGDLVVEIADGIHVRIARKALATVIKPEDEDDEEENETDDGDDEDETAEAQAHEPAVDEPSTATTGVEEVTNEGQTVNPGAAEPTAPSERS